MVCKWSLLSLCLSLSLSLYIYIYIYKCRFKWEFFIFKRTNFIFIATYLMGLTNHKWLLYIYIYIEREREESLNVNSYFIVNVRTTKIVPRGIFNLNIHALFRQNSIVSMLLRIVDHNYLIKYDKHHKPGVSNQYHDKPTKCINNSINSIGTK